MKVALDNIRLGHSPLTDSVFAGVLDSKTSTPVAWKHKKDVTNDFIAAVIGRWEGHTEKISSGINTCEITVKKIK